MRQAFAGGGGIWIRWNTGPRKRACCWKQSSSPPRTLPYPQFLTLPSSAHNSCRQERSNRCAKPVRLLGSFFELAGDRWSGQQPHSYDDIVACSSLSRLVHPLHLHACRLRSSKMCSHLRCPQAIALVHRIDGRYTSLVIGDMLFQQKNSLSPQTRASPNLPMLSLASERAPTPAQASVHAESTNTAAAEATSC
jgi:hypothetical protein